MATQTFNNLQELNAYLSQNPQIKGSINAGGQTIQYGGQPAQAQPKKERNFLESLVGSVIDPFVGLGKKTLEGVNAASLNKFGDFVSGNPNYQTAFLDQEEYETFKKNPLLDTLKDVAGVGSVFIPGGAGIKGLATAGLKSGALSSFANSDATDWRELDPTKIATDALIGGAVGGGLGIAGKAGGKLLEKFGGGKIGNKLVDAGESIQASNLGAKFKKDVPAEFTQNSIDSAVQQLKQAGKPITPFELENLANQNTQNFRSKLGAIDTPINFGGKNLDAETILAQSAGEIRPPALDKNIRPSAIKNALKKDPSLAPFQEEIDALESVISETNPKSLGIDIGRVQSKTNRAGFADGAKGLDTLAQELDSKFPGMGFADTTDPADAILRFNEIRNGYKQKLADTYETLHKSLLDADPDYAKSFGTTAQTIPSQITAGGGAKDEIIQGITSKLKGLGKNEIANSQTLQAQLLDKADEILNSGNTPAEIFDQISNLTVDSNVGNDFTLANKNKIIEATRRYLKDRLIEVVPEASQYFQSNAPLQKLLPDARTSMNNLNKVPVPFAQASINVPGVGALKQGATNLAGGALAGVGNLANQASGLSRFIPQSVSSQITPSNLTKAFVLGSNGMSQGVTEEMPMDTMGAMPQSDPLQGYNPQEVAQLYQYLTNNKGGNMSDSEAQNYLKLSYGIDLNPKSSAGGASASGVGKLTDASKKFVSAGNIARQALSSLESGKVSTGKIATVGNKLGEFFGTQSPEQTDYQSKLASARGSAINALAGANVPPSEYERIADMIPATTDEPNVAKQKLKSFIQAMGEYANPDLSSLQ